MHRLLPDPTATRDALSFEAWWEEVALPQAGHAPHPASPRPVRYRYDYVCNVLGLALAVDTTHFGWFDSGISQSPV